MQHQGDDAQDKEAEGHPHDRMDFLDFAGADLEDDPGHDAEHDAVGNGIGEGHHDQGHKAAQHVGDIAVELHLQHGFHHQQANKHQRRGGGKAGDGQEDGREEQGQNEHAGGGKSRQAGTAALGHARGGFHIAGDGGGAQAGARHGAHSVAHQGSAHLGELAVLGEQAALVGHADQSAHSIKEIYKQECKHDDHEIHHVFGDKAEIKLEERGGKGGGQNAAAEIGDQRVDAGFRIHHIPSGQLGDNAQHPGDQDAPQNGALYLKMPHDADDQKAHKGQHHRGAGNVAQRHQGGGVGNDDSCALQAHNGDKQADTGGNAELQVGRYGIHQGFPEFEQGKQNEDDALHQNRRQGDFPGIGDAHLLELRADRVGKVGVQAHAGSQRHRIVGEHAHDNGGKCRRNCRGGKHRALVHTRSGKDAGVHRQDVRHGQEGGNAGNNFGADVRAVLLQLEEFFQNSHTPEKNKIDPYFLQHSPK